MLQAICDFFECIGRARAARLLAMRGHYDLAKQVMLQQEPEFDVHP